MKLKTPKRATTTLKTKVRKQKVIALKRPQPFILKIPVNIVRILMCTGHWSWHVLNACTIRTRFVPYVITRSPRRAMTWKRAFFGATKTPRSGKPLFTPFPKRRKKMMINFLSLSNLCIVLFIWLVFNKVFKTVSSVCFSSFFGGGGGGGALLLACFNWSLLSY